MFPEMRRQDRAITEEARLLETLELAEFGCLATAACENGYPYTVALNHVMIDGKLYFHCADAGTKLDNIRRDAKACYTAVRTADTDPHKFTTFYESVMVFGTVQVVEDRDKRHFVLEKLIERFLKEEYPAHAERGSKYIDSMFERTVVLEFTIEHITGKAKFRPGSHG